MSKLSIALLVITDGRDEHLEQTIESARTNLRATGAGVELAEMWMWDDTGDVDHHTAMRKAYPMFEHVGAAARQGFGGAIRGAWEALAARSRADMIFHLEDDFVFERPVSLDAMAHVLSARRALVQLALRRQPWNAAERSAGGIVEQNPAAYSDMSDDAGCCHWLEHRQFFTTNPCLYRRALCHGGWPRGRESEGRFGLRILAPTRKLYDSFDAVTDELPRCGFWGRREDPPWVRHIGTARVGSGY